MGRKFPPLKHIVLTISYTIALPPIRWLAPEKSTFAILDRAGHFLQVEQEELFLALVDEWLQRVEEFGSSRHKRGLDYLQSVVNPKK